jgi:integrase
VTGAVARCPTGETFPVGTEFSHVLAGVGLAEEAAALAARIAPEFLVETGWDPVTRVWAPPAEHRFLGRNICRAPDCQAVSNDADRVCLGCRRRLQRHGLTLDEIDMLPPPQRRAWTRPGDGACAVPGCPRPWVRAKDPLCQGHRDRQQALGMSVAEFAAHPDTRPLQSLGVCAVAACDRQLAAAGDVYCESHLTRLRRARRGGVVVDETRWRITESPITHTGRILLTGLPPLVAVQVLFGVAQRAYQDIKSPDALLRWVVDELRRQQVDTVAEARIPPQAGNYRRGLLNSLRDYAHRGLLSPEGEVTKDVWDMTAFGYRGRLPFIAISQPWLRAAGKAWASHDLPRRRGTQGGEKTRHHINSLALLSESLRARPDSGRDPAALGRRDIEAFLARLSCLESTGKISGLTRHLTCTNVRAVLSQLRPLGLTVPHGPAAGLSELFALHRDDMPARPEPAEPGRDLPAEILAQLCEHLDRINSPQVRVAVEIAMDTGRRPEEICTLRYDCLARDNDDQPVLVYDNHKVNRLGRRLPISTKTADVITAQQQRVRHRFPEAPIGELKLLPAHWRNPHGRRAVTVANLEVRHREWVADLPLLRTRDGAEFDKTRAVLYAYRHTYAQRHADAGIGIDVLAELLDHRNLNVTKRYYRIGEQRRRAAVDSVTTLSFDRHGNRLWHEAHALLDSEHTRYAIGEVAVPYGRCSEPSNVAAGGGSCPIRFRCAGCDHFRTDVSYLPDLQGYLDDLLRTRERLAAALDGVDDWARADATPTDEEITRIRGLITRVKDDVAELSQTERAQIDEAVAVVRRHRAAHPVTLGLPTIRPQTPPAPAAPTMAETETIA